MEHPKSLDDGDKEGGFTDSYCRACGGLRRHFIEKLFDFFWEEPDSIEVEPGTWQLIPIQGGSRHYILRCAGCDFVSYLQKSWHDEVRDGETWVPEIAIQSFPEISKKALPPWLNELGQSGASARRVRNHLLQTYRAFDVGANWLCAMAVRGVIEDIMIAIGGEDKGSFKANLEELVQRRIIGMRQKDALAAAIDAGSAAIHRQYEPDEQTVKNCLSILENIVETLFIHEDRVDKLRSAVPTRRSAN